MKKIITSIFIAFMMITTIIPVNALEENMSIEYLSNGDYKEYEHPTPGLTRGAGPMRVITGGSKMWFTPDHYGTMIQIKF